MPVAHPPAEVCLCMALRRATREATRLYDRALQRCGLKITQYAVLRNIEGAVTINVTELSRKLDLERSAMGRNLDLLERKGFIRTVSSRSDLRHREVTLTDKGRALQEAAIPVWRAAQSDLQKRLRDGQLAALQALFQETSV